MLRVDLVFLFGLFAGENQIQRDLISLVHNRARAGRHFADVKLQHAGNRLQLFIGTGNQFVRRVRLRRVGPENDDMREHRANSCRCARQGK